MASNGFLGTVANSMLNATLRATSYTGPATLFIQLHTGAPGAAGTTNIAGNATRKAIAFNAASGGSSASTSDVVWTAVSNTETYTNFTIWDASTSGNLIGDGLVTANPITAGDTFTITAGNATVSLLVLS